MPPEPLDSPTQPWPVPFAVPFLIPYMTQSSLFPPLAHNALCICISMRCPSEIVICDLCFVLCIRSQLPLLVLYPVHGESLHATSIPFQSQPSQSNALISTLSLASDLALPLPLSLCIRVHALCSLLLLYLREECVLSTSICGMNKCESMYLICWLSLSLSLSGFCIISLLRMDWVRFSHSKSNHNSTHIYLSQSSLGFHLSGEIGRKNEMKMRTNAKLNRQN